ncbi:coenzyme A pyrophosphatase [Rhodococcoides trifolii]|uniref:Coenzyme A pyrophosphatase n=1 Tax=Rhodococcoides trifolii TaxID=908250 RepID=A0A917D6Z2_9NOCA|nr:CoA pyrophosphatase [Rhodococcus trifolii]GGG10955.1 coenzyme A pyrophosphatase [Rhodococcus trifolii]
MASDFRLERSAIEQALSGFEPRGIDESAPQGVRMASVVIAVAGEPGRRHIVLTRRPTTMRAHPGQFALPGGSVDAGETAVRAALRELHEEVGLELTDADVLGRLDDYVTRSGFVIRPFVVWAAEAPGPVLVNHDEVAVVYSVTATEIDVDVRFVTIPESPRPVIQWPFRESLVHAPTGAIVHQFREVVLAGRHTRVADFEQPVFAWR